MTSTCGSAGCGSPRSSWIAGLPIVLDKPQISSLAWVVICLSLLGWEILLAFRLRARRITVVRSTVGTLIQTFIVIDAMVSAAAAGWRRA